jgi:hypothetical protein
VIPEKLSGWLGEFAELIEFLLLLRLQLERVVIKVDDADPDARDFRLGWGTTRLRLTDKHHQNSKYSK